MLFDEDQVATQERRPRQAPPSRRSYDSTAVWAKREEAAAFLLSHHKTLTAEGVGRYEFRTKLVDHGIRIDCRSMPGLFIKSTDGGAWPPKLRKSRAMKLTSRQWTGAIDVCRVAVRAGTLLSHRHARNLLAKSGSCSSLAVAIQSIGAVTWPDGSPVEPSNYPAEIWKGYLDAWAAEIKSARSKDRWEPERMKPPF